MRAAPAILLSTILAVGSLPCAAQPPVAGAGPATSPVAPAAERIFSLGQPPTFKWQGTFTIDPAKRAALGGAGVEKDIGCTSKIFPSILHAWSEINSGILVLMVSQNAVQ